MNRNFKPPVSMVCGAGERVSLLVQDLEACGVDHLHKVIPPHVAHGVGWIRGRCEPGKAKSGSEINPIASFESPDLSICIT